MFGGMGGAGGGGADLAPVTPPAATSEAVASGGEPSPKTFGAFTDPDGRIASYSAAITSVVGSTAIASGSGLGAYTVSGSDDGDSYALRLTALDSEGEPLATAVHVVDIAVAEYEPLVPPATPAAQALASGVTSSAVISWGSPTGGSGSTTHETVLTQDVGAGASLSAGAVIGLEDGDVCRVRRTWTDAVTGQTVSAVTTVSVAAAAGGDFSYVQKTSLDLTGLTAGGPWSSGTQNIVKAGNTVITATVSRSGSTNGVVEAGSGGVRVYASSGTGQINCALALDTLLGTNDAFFTAGLVVLQIGLTIDTSIIVPASGSYMLVGVSNLTGQGQAFAGILFNFAGAGNVNAFVIYDNVTGSSQYSGAYPSEALITIEIYGGRASRVRLDVGTDTPVAPGLNLANVFPGQPVLASSASQFFGTQFHALVSNKSNADMRVTALRVDRLEAV